MRSYGLTARELAVVSLLIEGLADEQIAGRLGIPLDRVHQDLGNVQGKTGSKSRTEAAIRIIKGGFLRPGHTID
jgi:DNA-binding CsgD family transcriptional regulator